VIWNVEDNEGCLLSVFPAKDDMNEVAAEEFEKLIVFEEFFLSMTPFLGTSYWY
jgi:hypothetical protein